jgi:hypothetical protein
MPSKLEGEVVGLLTGAEQAGLENQIPSPADVRLDSEGGIGQLLGPDVKRPAMLFGLETDLRPHAGIAGTEHPGADRWPTYADSRPLIKLESEFRHDNSICWGRIATVKKVYRAGGCQIQNLADLPP